MTQRCKSEPKVQFWSVSGQAESRQEEQEKGLHFPLHIHSLGSRKQLKANNVRINEKMS